MQFMLTATCGLVHFWPCFASCLVVLLGKLPCCGYGW